jgi:acyl-coenzyme A thioesterase PaaI-like protein
LTKRPGVEPESFSHSFFETKIPQFADLEGVCVLIVDYCDTHMPLCSDKIHMAAGGCFGAFLATVADLELDPA